MLHRIIVLYYHPPRSPADHLTSSPSPRPCTCPQHTLSFTIPEEELALTGWDGRRVVLPGTYRLEFAGSGQAPTAELVIAKRTLVEQPLPPPFPSTMPEV